MNLPPTQALAHFVATTNVGKLPGAVVHEAKRAILNWVGCAVGASHHETVSRAVAALAPFFGPAQASILGRSERADILHAALMNGIASHTFDFDDTHLKTVIHPAGPVASAIVALAEQRPTSGSELLHAFALGVEVECRIGNAVYPSHYDVGWHITGTTGVFGAAAACGKLLGLSERQLVWALGIAATQSSGLREMFGSMCKPLHPGVAARNGLASALLAAQNFTSAEQGIEGRRGFASVLASGRDLSRITDRLGETWELLENTYKPFACGIVIHPTIDGCTQLRNAHAIDPGLITAVKLRVNPLVLELTGKKSPRIGLEGKFSVYHSAAVAILDGDAGEEQYSDERVRDARVVTLRDKVEAAIDEAVAEDAAHVTIEMKTGASYALFVEHAIGSLARPMSDSDLERKFAKLCAPHLARERIERVIGACWSLDRAENAAELPRLCIP